MRANFQERERAARSESRKRFLPPRASDAEHPAPVLFCCRSDRASEAKAGGTCFSDETERLRAIRNPSVRSRVFGDRPRVSRGPPPRKR